MRLTEHVLAFAEGAATDRASRDDVIFALWLLAGAPPASPAVERAALRVVARVGADPLAIERWLSEDPRCRDLVTALFRLAADAQTARARDAARRLLSGG